jgi:2-keto-4-pentenoate hydratase
MTTAQDWAQALDTARRSRRAIPPLSTTDPTLTVRDAYEIQQEYASLILDGAGSVVGYKLGLTSKPMQQMLGVDQPDHGPILSTMVYGDGARLRVADYIEPRAEAEIAVMLAAPLRGPGVTAQEAATATRGAIAAIEVVDSRIEDWKIRLVDTIADMASSAAVVLSPHVVAVDGWDPRLCGTVVTRSGETVAMGVGAAALGGPFAAVAWLANTLASFDVTLQPGHFVMTGALHAALPVSSGDEVRAEFDHLGAVSVVFDGG